MGPALEALKYTGHEESLREMYAELIASSLQKSKSDTVHPAFVEVIKQLTPAEARLIVHLKRLEEFPVICKVEQGSEFHWKGLKDGEYFVLKAEFMGIWSRFEEISTDECSSSLDNLLRLKIITISDTSIHEPKLMFEKDEFGYDEYLEEYEKEPKVFKIERERTEKLHFTTFGIRFVNACVE